MNHQENNQENNEEDRKPAMKNKPIINLNNEQKAVMISAIKKYFLNDRDEDLGDLASMLLLDFFIEKLAPEFYNQGVYDSYQFMIDKSEDLLGIQK